MPTNGVNLTLSFDTTQQEGDKYTYPFTTQSSGLPPIELGSFVAYSGDTAYTIGVQHYIFSLCDTPTDFEYNYPCPDVVFNDGEEIAVELSIDRRYREYRFSLCPSNTWDYAFECGDILIDGESLSVSLFTDRVQPIYNFPICTEYKPDLSAFYSEYQYICDDLYTAVDEDVFDIDLTVSKLVQYNLSVCELEGVNDYEYDIVCYDAPFEVDFIDDDTLSIELSLSDLSVETFGVQDENFNLTSCVSSPDFDITGCTTNISVDGKNKYFELIVCASDANPELEANPHNFAYKKTWQEQCDIWEFIAYDGDVLDAKLAKTIDFEAIGYDGDYVESTLALSQYLNAIAYDGDYSDATLTDNPIDTFEVTYPDGDYADADLSASIQISVTNNDGDVLDVVLTDNPFDQLEVLYHDGDYADADLYSYSVFEVTYPDGDYADADLKTQPLILFDVLYHDGDYADADLTDNPAKDMKPTAYDGDEAVLDYLATTFALYPVAYDGDYVEAEMNRAATLDGVAYDGDYSDVDFTPSPPAEMNPVAYDGEVLDVDVKFTQTLFPRAYDGDYSDADFTTVPGAGLQVTFHDGEYSDAELSEDTFYFRFHDGDEAVLDYLATTFALYPVAYDGDYAQVDVNRAATLYPVAHDGDEAYIPELYVTPGQEFEPVAYDGENLFVQDAILIYPTFNPRPIVSSETLYDGFGGVGGLNFCESTRDYPPSGDAVVFDTWDYERKPWGLCPPEVDDGVEFDLAVNQRLSVDFFDGDFSQTYTSHPHLQPYPIECGESSYFYLEPNMYIRFCPGYLIPAGDNVVFDFSSDLNLNCQGWFAQDGETVAKIDLSVPAGLAPRAYDGENVYFWLYVPGPWMLRTYDGERAVVNNPDMYAKAHDGDVCYVRMERRAYLVHEGENAHVISLELSVPGIKFLTPSACLENQYRPLTEDGDIDWSYDQPGTTIELEPFRTKIEAECTNEWTYYAWFYTFQFDGDSASCGLKTESVLEVVFDDGDAAWVDMYNTPGLSADSYGGDYTILEFD